jgi:4-alpha-glucanotransferase
LIGHLPFFVAPDSSDVWANPELFLLDQEHHPDVVAGVPPDYFSAEGQLWGNPVFDWDALRENGYRWCVDPAQPGQRGADERSGPGRGQLALALHGRDAVHVRV